MSDFENECAQDREHEALQQSLRMQQPSVATRQRIAQLEQERDAAISEVGKVARSLGTKEAECERLERELAEADRRAGEAERLLSYKSDSLSKLNDWRDEQKEQAGYHRNVSFDVVWAETLAKAQESDRLRKALEAKQDEVLAALASAEKGES